MDGTCSAHMGKEMHKSSVLEDRKLKKRRRRLEGNIKIYFG